MNTTKPAPLETAYIYHIAKGEMAWLGAIVWRRGEPTRVVVRGRRDVERDLPVVHDTISRIASLTKPVLSVAALTLLDEGRFDLDDSIARVAPELEHLRVLQDPDGPLDSTVPAARAITFRD